MLFQLAWTGLSVLFWLFGSQRGLLALGLGSFGFASRFGFLGPIAGLVSYFVVPEVCHTIDNTSIYLIMSLIK